MTRTWRRRGFAGAALGAAWALAAQAFGYPALVPGAEPLAASISAASEKDVYQFTVGTEGTYVVETRSGTLADTFLSLAGPDDEGALLEEDDDDGAGFAALIRRTLAPGTYFATVRARVSSRTGTYSVLLTQEGASSDVELVAGAPPTEGRISAASEVDVYRFTLAQAGGVILETRPALLLGDSVMALTGPDDAPTVVEEDDDDGPARGSRIVRALQAGSYRVRVRAKNPAKTFSYTVALSQWRTLVVNGVGGSAQLQRAAQVDDWQFVVDAPGQHTVETSLTPMDTVLSLHGPNDDSVLLTEDDDGGRGAASRITRVLTPGTYFARVRAHTTSRFVRTGSYAIRVTAPQPGAEPGGGAVAVVLVHGWNGAPETFGPVDPDTGRPAFAGLLAGEFRVGRVFDYDKATPLKQPARDGPVPRSIEQLAGALHVHVQRVLGDSAAAGANAAQVDVVAHSMGGLIARTYVAGLARDASGARIPYPRSIRRLVTLGTPHFGTSRFNWVPSPGTQRAQQFPASRFLLDLDRAWEDALDRGDFGRGDLLQVIGTADGVGGGDGLVVPAAARVPSRHLAAPADQVRYVPYWHASILGLLNLDGAGAVAEVTSAQHLTYPLVREFLAGRTPPVLLAYGGIARPPSLLVVEARDARGNPFPLKAEWIRIDGAPAPKPWAKRTGTFAFLMGPDADDQATHTVSVQVPPPFAPLSAPFTVGAYDGSPVVLRFDVLRK